MRLSDLLQVVIYQLAASLISKDLLQADDVNKPATTC
jgi:hypothetical protein